MIGFRPKRPSGVTPEARFMQWVFDSIASLTPQQVQGQRVNRTTRGAIVIPSSKPAGSVTGSGMTFRGEWAPDMSYKVGDVVVIRDGISAGCYICILDQPGHLNPPALPDVGIYWVCLAKNDSVGTWL